ncbi:MULTISPECIES: anhydro-N-acetylmuramic acid kinase [unclassified Microbacterium]|uniref:anhydro-N-acetylmuramic acid kinase n=1 Tax=unclassified Microbacterium TaxID=2609290 RepID=UPI000EA912E4|nr:MULTISPECIES: anhydro-N-acetylmuramic acid kinase [unclassified Microbacterium]MBT2483767.1 anhydro-N-acetylmuramic acid kinase [Microbacterium sp. ISL-108]RKN66754.1 anhydro-N-acetylmuramic acid kinase [Microbacterium sp. CGR2]
MRVLGLLSGTSHDGIDVAVVDFTVSDGALRGTVLHEGSHPYAPELRTRLVAALPPSPTTFAEVCELDTLIGQAFAQVAADAAAAVGGVDAVCTHGQTVFHWVEGDHARGTLQIGQPAWIAEAVGAPVVSDVRIRDIAAGGHGAPLVSFLDELLLRGRAGVSAAVNLGGIANITIVGEAVSAYDIGPANALVDAVVTAEALNARSYDADAAIARTGAIDESLLAALLDDSYYALPAPKSTGKEHFHLDYVRAHTAGREISTPDLVRTLTELTVQAVARDVRTAGVGYLAVSGGGCHNPLIMDGLRAALPEVEVVLADELGASVDSKEAILFALIGWCTLHGVPAVLPSATGARAPRILGTITPGAGPLRLPEPVAAVSSLALD